MSNNHLNTHSSIIKTLSNMSFCEDYILELTAIENIFYHEDRKSSKILTVSPKNIPKIFDLGLITKEYNPSKISFVFNKSNVFENVKIQYVKKDSHSSFFMEVDENIEYLDSYFIEDCNDFFEQKNISSVSTIFNANSYKCIEDIKLEKIDRRNEKVNTNKKYFIEKFENDVRKYENFLGLPNYIIEDMIQYVLDVAYGTEKSKYHNHYYCFKPEQLDLAFNNKLSKNNNLTLNITAISSKILPLNNFLTVKNSVMFTDSNVYEELVLNINASGNILDSCLKVHRIFGITTKSAIFVYFDKSLNIIHDSLKYLKVIDRELHTVDFESHDIPLNDVMMLLKLKFNLNEEIKEIIPEIYYAGAYNFNSSDFNQRLDLIDLILY